jgi:malate permease and related proteins
MILPDLATLVPALVAVIVPVFVGAWLGWLWTRLGRTFDTAMVSDLVTQIGTPCLVFNALTKLDVAPAALGQMAAASFLSYALVTALGVVVLLLWRLPFHSYLPALMFGNAGNMGLPLCLFAFGDLGLALAIAYFAVAVGLQFTVGVWIAAGAVSLGQVLRMPVLWAVLVALGFMAAGRKPPEFVSNTAQLFGGLTIPLMLMALGVSLGKLRVTSVPRAVVFSILRLAGGFGAGLAGAWLFGLTGAARGVLLIQATMPVAVFNYLFALHYKRAPEEIAGMVVISTLISFASLPLLLALVL